MKFQQFGNTGRDVSVIGQGTWYIDQGNRRTPVAALRRGIDLGMTHIDTAEMYGDVNSSLPRRSRAGAMRSSSSPRSCRATPRTAAPLRLANVRSRG